MICSTCNKPDHSPWRVYGDNGKVLLGCVDACHTGNLVLGTESIRWHHRQDAVRIRAKGQTSLWNYLPAEK